MIQPYEGSTRAESTHENYERMRFPVGPARHFFGPVKDYVAVEGAVTRLTYDGPQGRSPLEIFRNYRDALSKNGFTELAQGSAPPDPTYRASLFLEAFGLPEEQSWCYDYATERSHYLVAAGKAAGRQVHVAVFTSECKAVAPLYRGVRTIVWIVESKAMEVGKVDVDAQAMWKEIREKGAVALYGIYFDFDQSRIRPESTPTLREVSRLLRQQPTLRLYVVGHTDMKGTLDYNLNLSKARATAVVRWLQTEGGAQSGRLFPYGLGPLAPRSTNREDSGRAINRRVELIEKLD